MKISIQRTLPHQRGILKRASQTLGTSHYIHEETLQEEAHTAAARAPGDLSGEGPMSPYGVWWVPRGGGQAPPLGS